VLASCSRSRQRPTNLDGTSTLHRHESLEAVASFYGPNSGHYGRLARDNAMIGQNRDVLSEQNIVLTEVGSPNTFAELVNQIFRGRTDVTFWLRRQVSRVYPIRSLVDAPIELDNSVFDSQPMLYPTITLNPDWFRQMAARGEAAATAQVGLGRNRSLSAPGSAGTT
jgi:hypothetical protein